MVTKLHAKGLYCIQLPPYDQYNLMAKALANYELINTALHLTEGVYSTAHTNSLFYQDLKMCIYQRTMVRIDI